MMSNAQAVLDRETDRNSRGELVQAAINMFYENGYLATDVKDILNEANLPESVMMENFGSKHDLILAALEKWDGDSRAWLISEMEKRGSTPHEQLLGLYDALSDWFVSDGFRGCMFINATAEFGDRNDPVHQAAADHKKRFAAEVLDIVKATGAKRPEILIGQLMVLMEGAIVTSHMSGSNDAGLIAREMAEKILSDALG